ncbi:MAG: tetratricopeptide repeat protein [Acidobacteriota bacterium]
MISPLISARHRRPANSSLWRRRILGWALAISCGFAAASLPPGVGGIIDAQEFEELEPLLQKASGDERLDLIVRYLGAFGSDDAPRAVELGEEAFARLGDAPAAQLEVDVVCGLCKAHQWNDAFDKAIELGERCVAKAEALGDRPQLASGLLWCLGQGHSRKRQPGLAIVYKSRAIDIYEDLGPPRELAAALTRAGLDLTDLGDFTAGIESQLRALRLFNEVGDKNGAAQALLRIGTVKLDIGEMEGSLEYTRRSYETFSALGHDHGTAAALHNMGIAQLELSQYDRALELFEESLDIRRRLGQPFGVAVRLLNIGEVHTRSGAPERALPLMEEALATFKSVGAQREVALGGVYLARTFMALGDPDRARSVLRDTIELAEAEGFRTANTDAHKVLAEAEESRGDLAAALAAQRRHQELANELLERTNDRRIAEMEVRFQAEEQAREIEELREQKAQQDREVAQQRTVRRALIFGFILLLAVLGLLFNRYRLRADARRMAETIEHEKAVSAGLRRVDRLKDEFLANTSHELRTPLFGIVGLTESLLDGAAGALPDPAKKDLELILHSGMRLSGLVADILDSAKLKQHDITLQLGPVDLHSLTDIVLTLSRPLNKGRRLELINAVPAGTPILADPDRLQQVLHNLVGNAVKFTEEGEVRVGGDVRGDELLIEVSDTGIGIRPEHQATIFKAFEQGDASTERAYGGTGLGLAISQQLLNLHGSDLGVRSAPGEGATFFFTLPLAPAADGVGEAEPTAARETGMPAQRPGPASLTAVTGSATKAEHSGPIAMAPAPAGAMASDAPVILAIDDEPVNQQVLRNHLMLHGHRVLSASSGAEALEVMDKESVDLILLDIMMPRMSGYEVCRRIREEHSREDLPVIFLSAKNRAPDRIASFEEGGNDYLAKPIAKLELLKRVDTQLELLKTHRTQSEELKVLRGLLTICSSCKDIRDDGEWGPLDAYVDKHSEASFSHGLCPTCIAKLYPDLNIELP